MSVPTPYDLSAIRDAASVVVVRRDADRARVLMGQRGREAAFMPSKWVFPGGALDPADAEAAVRFPPPEALALRLGAVSDAAPDRAHGAALALASLRELSEETGLAPRCHPDDAVPTGALPDPWSAYVERHGAPNARGLSPLARAVTPPGRPRRFDARFVLLDAADLVDPDDFSGADGELAGLDWLALDAARTYDLPFVTALVLAEVEARLDTLAGDTVPFFRHADGRSYLDPL